MINIVSHKQANSDGMHVIVTFDESYLSFFE